LKNLIVRGLKNSLRSQYWLLDILIVLIIALSR